MAAGTRATLDLSTLDPLQLALAAETAARATLGDAAMLGACSERQTGDATARTLELGQALAILALLMGVLDENWDVFEPVLAACLRGDRVEVEDAAPERARGDERPALVLVAR
ncbi:hypothetical protein MKK88_20555 [Methylobacterium sp. E-005]|uniref:hypothetical protein n=1 Tax=Methylobacterium sp. E-005 TaxID=2836549 RepID=UPI001FBAE5BD|nr:hypothetical protein [Methylobacterium sp. E-005]MCJ2088358.1 hypothetical protein [Methylobacterium sp. E-005]